jgi:hypothetical protein
MLLRRAKSRWQASAHTASLTQVVPNRRHIHIEYCPQPIGNRKAGMRAATPSFEVMVDNCLTSQFCRQRQMAGVANGMREAQRGCAANIVFPTQRSA